MATRRLCSSPLLAHALSRRLASAQSPAALSAAQLIANASAATPPPLHTLTLSPSSLVLGIESSCDDTGVAVVRGDGVVLGQALVTQSAIHAPYGGVVPRLAQAAHADAIDATIQAALDAAGVRDPGAELGAVAVTAGPGLSMCLAVGGRAARALAAAARVPLIPVHHLEAHALMGRLPAALEGGSSSSSGSGGGSGGSAATTATATTTAAATSPAAPPAFPFLCVLASGGHNLTLRVDGVGRYAQLGTTLDDALGEAFDKVGRLLGLPAVPSGGAAVEAAAARGDPAAFAFSRPLARRARNGNVSYAGLKTAVRLAAERAAPGPPSPENERTRCDLAASFQAVAVAHLADRAAAAAEAALADAARPGGPPRPTALVLAGGVAANATLRAALAGVADRLGLPLVVPRPALCTDNGVMVAWAGVERARAGLALALPPLEGEGGGEGRGVDGWVEVRPRWPLAGPPGAAGGGGGSAAAVPPNAQSARKSRLHPSLTELTEAAVAAGDAPVAGQWVEN